MLARFNCVQGFLKLVCSTTQQFSLQTQKSNSKLDPLTINSTPSAGEKNVKTFSRWDHSLGCKVNVACRRMLYKPPFNYVRSILCLESKPYKEYVV